ncbi:MAG: hypothetical protein JNK82_04105 [Myxococcaceae bacterium]|nr:hypothetical protein [Myxococcaceae bacterium]
MSSCRRRSSARATFVPYYRKRWGTRWRRVNGPEDLHLLPLLTKDEAIAHQRELLVGDARRAYGGTLSSGTMSGEQAPLRVAHVPAEAQALHDFFHRGVSGPPAARRGPKRFVLEVRAMHHGMPEGPPAPNRVRVPWTYTANALRLIRELLAVPQADGPRCSGGEYGSSGGGSTTSYRYPSYSYSGGSSGGE